MSDAPLSPSEEALAILLESEMPGPVPPALAADARGLFQILEAMKRYAQSVSEHSSDALLDLAANTSAWVPNPFPGEFAFRRKLGSGSFGDVWLANDLNLGISVAVKTLKQIDDFRLASLKQEARHLAKIRHPNIAQVYSWRTAGSEHHLVMRYVAGGSFAERVAEQGPLEWALAARYAADAAEALAVVHAAGLVHRDVKPSNLLWDADEDEAILTDFGPTTAQGLKQSGAGTMPYIGLEALDGFIEPSNDVYGLAATLFHFLAGSPPHAAKSTPELRAALKRGLADPEPRLTGVPEAIERIVRKSLAPDPRLRPDSRQFADQLRGALNQSMRDSLPAPGASGLRVLVSHWDGARFAPLGLSQAAPTNRVRDMKKVPVAPLRVVVRTGDRLRVEVTSDTAGYLTVFNVGPQGGLNRLIPEGPATQCRPGLPVRILDIELTPPAGSERLFAVLTRTPLELDLASFEQIAGGSSRSREARATRDLKRIQRRMEMLPADDWQSAVLELDHREPA